MLTLDTKKLDTIEVVDRRRWSSDLYTTEACRVCGAHFHYGEQRLLRHLEEITCSICSAKNSRHNAKFTAMPEFAHLIEDPALLFEMSWFHGTNMDAWIDKVQKPEPGQERPYVHVGSRAAAMDIVRAKYTSGFRIWEVAVSREAVFAEGIHEDNNSWFYDVTESARKAMKADGLLYLNRWESPGSISIIVDPKFLTVKGLEEF